MENTLKYRSRQIYSFEGGYLEPSGDFRQRIREMLEERKERQKKAKSHDSENPLLIDLKQYQNRTL